MLICHCDIQFYRMQKCGNSVKAGCATGAVCVRLAFRGSRPDDIVK